MQLNPILTSYQLHRMRIFLAVKKNLSMCPEKYAVELAIDVLSITENENIFGSEIVTERLCPM